MAKKNKGHPISMRIDRDVWEEAKVLGNRSKHIQNYLKHLVDNNPDIISQISICKLCENYSNLKYMFKFSFPSNDVRRATFYFICRECFLKLKENKPDKNWDKELVVGFLKSFEEVEKEMKRWNLPNMFTDYIGVYDGKSMGNDAEFNDIKSLIQEIKEKPQLDWKAKKGELSVDFQGFFDIDDEEYKEILENN